MPFVAVNPATGEVVQRFATHTSDQVEAALQLSQEAYPSWRALSYGERATYMVRAAELL